MNKRRNEDYKVTLKQGAFRKTEEFFETYNEAIMRWLEWSEQVGAWEREHLKIYTRKYKWVDKQGELGIESRDVPTSRWSKAEPDLSYALGNYLELAKRAYDWGKEYYDNCAEAEWEMYDAADEVVDQLEIAEQIWRECEVDTDYAMVWVFVDEMVEEKGVDDVDLTRDDEHLIHWMLMRGVADAYDADVERIEGNRPADEDDDEDNE